MNRAEALAILDLPRHQAEAAIVSLWEKAEQWERSQLARQAPTLAPTTPSGMTPVYLKPRAGRRLKKPGRKAGHAGACRPTPRRIDAHRDHRLKDCPECGAPVGQPIRHHTRLIEDIPPPEVTAHTVHGYWCSRCQKIVAPKVAAASPRSSLGLRFVVLTAWLHYLVGVSVGNCVKTAQVALGFRVSPGGLTLAWQNLATLLEAHYQAIGQNIRASAVLHADETGWRVNGVTFWLWAFATREYCYYVIDRRRGAGVVKRVLGALFPGILITDFWGAYNAIEALAKQRCYFHLFTEFVKVDQRNTSVAWRCFRKTLARLLKDAVRLGERRQQDPPATFARRKAKLHKRLDELIATPVSDADAKRLIKRLRRHRGELFTFLDHAGVSPYNNHAEQQMRTAVHTRKVCQQNRSLNGAKTHAILMTLFRSAQLQGLNPVEYLLQLTKATIAGDSTDMSALDQIKKAA